MRLPQGVLSLFVISAACGGTTLHNQHDANGDGGGFDATPCQGLECYQVTCATPGDTTSISGVVYAPNGTLPLPNVTVYVPNGTVQPLPSGAQCDQCGAPLSGDPLVQTLTNAAGEFLLTDMPATSDVPLVIQVGKWRRQITIPAVPDCEDTELAAADTRLPKNKSEGDIPQMALTTGSADALECLLPKIGLDIAEFTTASGNGRVHLFTGAGGTDQFDPAVNAGATFEAATNLWSATTTLDNYDIVFLSCEGGQNAGSKPIESRQALKDYTDLGGRVFASHWHNYWLQNGPTPWDTLATWNFQSDLNNIEADVNQTFESGARLAEWLVNVDASTTLGKIAIQDAQHTVTGVDTGVDRWIYKDTTNNGTPSVQYFAFTTPFEDPIEERCGRVVYSDIHVSSGDDSGSNLTFPSGGCTTEVTELTPQEKVLAFMIFDIASCVDVEG